MSLLQCRLIQLKKEMSVDSRQMQAFAGRFAEEIEKGLSGKQSSLKMLSSYLDNPGGDEKGIYLALDFGGTNVRVFLVELKGGGSYRIIRRISAPLKNREKGYDYTSGESDATDLFNFIAGKIKLAAQGMEQVSLGHTFSFPFAAKGINGAILLNWTKEFKTRFVEGEDVTRLLSEAFRRQGVDNVIPQAVINDTVATQLTAAYADRDCDLATILGTGHNSCYRETASPWHDEPVIINLEAGGFDKLNYTVYDDLLDKRSASPGKQRLEKMVAGKYMGELVQTILKEWRKDDGLFSSSERNISSEDVSAILGDKTTGLHQIAAVLRGRLSVMDSSWEERKVVQEICRIVVQRSVLLAVSAFLGIIKHMDPLVTRRHMIAVDGALYAKMPGYAPMLEKALRTGLGDKSDRIKVKQVKDGSGIGAALAAAMIQRKGRYYK